MRRIATILTIVFALSFVSAGAEYLQIKPIADDISVTVEESNNSRTVVRFEIGGFNKEAIQINGQTYYKISCGDEAVLLNAGEPALPHINRSVIIPDDGIMDIRVLSSQYNDYPLTPVAPSKGHLLRTINPDDVPYSFGQVYGSDEWYGGELASIGEPYILRDFRGSVIQLNGFQYNPATQTLRVYTSVTVEVFKTASGGANAIDRKQPLTTIVDEFDMVYRERFINYGYALTLYNPVPETGTMLIITNDSYNSFVLPFVEWKRQKGITTTIVNVSTIGNTSTAIKNYIQSIYNTQDLAFVLLVGDNQHVATPSAHGGAADPTYAKLAGNDNYPDVFIGRFSAESTTDVSTQVTRSVDYEKTPQGTGWFSRGTGIASDQGPGHYGEYDYQHMNLIRTDLLNYGFVSVDQIYDPGATASQVTNALNNGRSVINYCGHGSSTSWGTTGFSNSNVNALNNPGMLPFIFSVACVNGDFDGGGPCFAEAWLRARTTGNLPKGALATYMSSINQYWDEPMYAQDEAADILCANSKNTFGGICFNSSCRMIELMGTTGVEMYDTWHIFGDPSVQVRTSNPQAMTVNHAGTITVGSTSYSVTAVGINKALCALYLNGTIFGAAYTNLSGQATIPIGSPLNPGDVITLTVTAYNRQTYIGSVTVASSGTCSDVNMTPDNSPVTVPPGGSFGLTGIIGNPNGSSIVTDVWVGVIYQNIFYQLWNFQNIPLNAGQVLSAHLNQSVPSYATPGTYKYIAYSGDHPTACDSASFSFTVTGSRTSDEVSDWYLRGGWDAASEIPEEISLIGNYPNPFNAATTINYALPEAGMATLEVYNLVGQKLETLIDGYYQAGTYSVNWDAASYSSGVYFCKLTVGQKTFTKRMTLLK